MAKSTVSDKQQRFDRGDGRMEAPFAGTTAQAGILKLDGTAANIQPIAASASAGSNGLAADSGHAHPATAAAFNALNPNAAPAGFTPGNPTGTVSTTEVMMGLGAICTYTPRSSGLVQVTITGMGLTNTSNVNWTLGCRYGTGTAPANGAAVTGTIFGSLGDQPAKNIGGGIPAYFAFTALLALTPSTAYWFDLALSTASASDQAALLNVSMVLAELPAG